MGRNGLAQLLRYTILDSFVSKLECESCRPKTEALEEAFEGGGEKVLEAGGLSGVVFNASKEVALDRFISADVTFDQMSTIVQNTISWMEKTEKVSSLVCNLENIFQINSKARKFACKLVLD